MATDSDHDARTAESLIRDLQALASASCRACSKPLGAREVLMAIALGFKDSPRCLACLATAMETDARSLGQSVLDYIRGRECFAEAWRWASREAGLSPELAPATPPFSEPVPPSPLEFSQSSPTATDPSQVSVWDAGDQACGELVLELRLRMERLKPGEILELIARDPGVPQDLPAWCRLTGHRLVRSESPRYWLMRKGLR